MDVSTPTSSTPASPLQQRMLEDMRMRHARQMQKKLRGNRVPARAGGTGPGDAQPGS
jgi:hypothetical protein